MLSVNRYLNKCFHFCFFDLCLAAFVTKMFYMKACRARTLTYPVYLENKVKLVIIISPLFSCEKSAFFCNTNLLLLLPKFWIENPNFARRKSDSGVRYRDSIYILDMSLSLKALLLPVYQFKKINNKNKIQDLK